MDLAPNLSVLAFDLKCEIEYLVDSELPKVRWRTIKFFCFSFKALCRVFSASVSMSSVNLL